jgi:predicted RNA binding protein YcfA (HicA-like mRNA interferase family)
VSAWPSTKAGRVYRALLRIGWTLRSEKGGSHQQLQREGWPSYTWAFRDRDELGPVMLKKIAKLTGLTPDDL